MTREAAELHGFSAKGGSVVAILLALVSACSDDDALGTGLGGGASGGGGGDSPTCVPPESEVDGACIAAGVPADGCAAGFSPDANGGCLPILPPAPCADGEVALPGETTCRPLADCGSGTWGLIPKEVGTEHVDPSYAGNDSDGSDARPWTDLQSAVAAADEGDVVALAAGKYPSSLSFAGKRLRVWGRCPQLVELAGESSTDALYLDASGFELHQVALTSVGFGLIVFGATDVLVDRVHLHDTGDVGVLVTTLDGPSGVIIQDSLIERAAAIAVLALSSDIEIKRTVVRDTVENALGPGRGIDAERDVEVRLPSNVVVTGCLVERAHEAATASLGSSLTMIDSAVVETLPQADGRFGLGMAVQYADGEASASIRGSYIGDSHMFGVSVINAAVSLERSSISGVRRQVLGNDFGDGVAVVDTSELASIEISESRIANAMRAGIANFSGHAALDRVALDCNTIQLDGESPFGAHTFDNQGGNACWCGEVSEPCKVLESNLEAPPAQ